VNLNRVELTGQEAKILLLNDWHIGSNAYNKELEQKILQYIKKYQPRILLNGDIFHNINKHSKGSAYDQALTPQEQLDYAVKVFKPFAHLIDGVILGNHDYRTERESEIDIMLIFCQLLGIEEAYLKYRGVVGYSINKHYYTIEMFHGTGAGGTISAIERTMNSTKRTTADIYYIGHFHKEYVRTFKEYNIDNKNSVIKEYQRVNICGNSLTDTEGYAKMHSYSETFPSQALITLNGRKRGIGVEWIRE
jgi:hypothetical protein